MNSDDTYNCIHINAVIKDPQPEHQICIVIGVILDKFISRCIVPVNQFNEEVG